MTNPGRFAEPLNRFLQPKAICILRKSRNVVPGEKIVYFVKIGI